MAFWDLAKAGTCVICALKVSQHTKFEGSNWTIDFRNACCYPEQAIKQTVDLPVIGDALPHMWGHCYVCRTRNLMKLSNETLLHCIMVAIIRLTALTHWGRDKMAAIFKTTFSSAFSWMKIIVFWLQFHWNMFLGVQLTLFHHWSR